MYEELELLDFSEEFEAIEKRLNCYDFPALYVGEKRIYFNKSAARFLEGTEALRFYTSTNYVVMKPDKKGNYASFSVIKHSVCHPVALQSKKVQYGWYKLYRTKDGFAFKRYEQLQRAG